MVRLCMSSSPAPPLRAYCYNTSNRFLSPQTQRTSYRSNRLFGSLTVEPPFSPSLSFFKFNPLRFPVKQIDNHLMSKKMKKKEGRGYGAVCYAAPPLTVRNLQWVSTISSLVLMLSSGTAIHKSFLVPLLALQAPPTIISWIKGDYGVWAAFLALLVRLFFFIPGELELPFMALLLVIVAPYQVINLRGTQEGAIIALVIAGYLAFQHFSRMGNLRKAFEQGSIISTLAVICITAISCLLLI